MSFVVASCGGSGGAGKDDATAENARVPVETMLTERRGIDANYSGTASLEADREADVVAKASGVLLHLAAEEGGVVKQGQVLARLDDASARLNVAKTQAMLRKLEADYRRADEMFEKKLLSLEQHDKIKFDLENQRANYDLARLELSYTTVVAPIDGVIGKRFVKEGNLIQLNQPLFHIVDFDPLLGVLNVPERELNTLKPDQVVTLKVDALPGRAFTGRIQRISPVVEPASGTFRVTSEFHDDTGQLKPGMFGRIGVVYDRKLEALAIPRSALIEEDGETAVFLVVPAPPPTAEEKAKLDAKAAEKKVAKGDANAAEKSAKPAEPKVVAQRRTIKIGYSDGDYVEVREGLNDGDRVITVGRNAVRDGTEVQVLEAAK